MAHADIQKWATPEVFQKFVSLVFLICYSKANAVNRYDKEILRRSLLSNELYVVCLNPECDTGQMHTGSGELFVQYDSEE
jgi:hypothetical protein